MNLLEILKIAWPVLPMFLGPWLAWRQFQQTRLSDLAKAKHDREAEAARLDALREGRDELFRTGIIKLSEEIAMRTIADQQDRINTLNADNEVLRRENTALRSEVAQLRGDVANLQQVVESYARLTKAEGKA